MHVFLKGLPGLNVTAGFVHPVCFLTGLNKNTDLISITQKTNATIIFSFIKSEASLLIKPNVLLFKSTSQINILVHVFCGLNPFFPVFSQNKIHNQCCMKRDGGLYSLQVFVEQVAAR